MGDRAETCRHVQGRTAERAVLELDGLARVDSDPHAQRKIGVGPRLLDELLLEVNSGADGLSGGLENDKRFVAANLDQRPPRSSAPSRTRSLTFAASLADASSPNCSVKRV